MKVEYSENLKFSLLSSAEVDGKVYILGSNEVLCDLVDLCAYGLKFFPKVTENPLTYLPLEQKPTDLTTAEVIRKTMFPTKSDHEVDTTINYFGSISSGSQTLYMISIPRGSQEVMFKEGEETKITVKMEEENRDETLLWFVVSRGIPSDINLSYYSWLRSSLPHRNYQEHVVGPDYPVEVVEEEGGYWFDKTSGTILANSEPVPTPILNALRDKFKDDTSWSPRVHYRKGETVDGWIAIEDNIGEYPPYSGSWISEDTVKKFKRDISVINCSGGDVTPGIVPTPTGSSLEIVDSVRLNYGYFLSNYIQDSLNAYLDGTLLLTNLKDVVCKKTPGILSIPAEEARPLIEVYINGEPKWPKANRTDIGITKELRVPLGESFQTDSFLFSSSTIGEILGITKSYFGDSINNALRVESEVDSLYVTEDGKTPFLSDTISLPARKVVYDITLTNYEILLTIGEYSGFYVNTTKQTSSNNETKYFYLRPISPSLETCSVELHVGGEKLTTLEVSPGKPEDYNNLGGGSSVKVVRGSDSMITLTVENPIKHLNFNIYGS